VTFQRPYIETQQIGGFALRKALHAAQPDRGACFFRQLVKCFRQSLQLLAGAEAPLW
jgi:hypothetical protein